MAPPADRCRSLSRAADCWYAATASAGRHCPDAVAACGLRQACGVPSGQRPATSAATSGCSGASTTYVAPASVSGRVVNTSTRPLAGPASGSQIVAPSLAPIQLRCCCLMFSGQARSSRSSTSRCGQRGDPHHPLPQRPPVHRVVADVAAAVGRDLLVGQHGAKAGTPVDRLLGDVGQPAVIDEPTPLQLGQRIPRSAVGRQPLTRRVLGNQLGDRPGLCRSARLPSC